MGAYKACNRRKPNASPGVVRLDEAVAVEQDALALLQDYLLLLVTIPGRSRRIPVALSSSAPSLRPARRRRADRVPRRRRRDARPGSGSRTGQVTNMLGVCR